MLRRLRSACLVGVILTGCETTGPAERDARRQEELSAVNQGRSPDQQVVPRTIREANDPLLVDPTNLPDRPRR